MDNILFAYLTSLWLGILTSISPCPLASNIAAVSYLGGQINTKYSALLSGIFYAAGRTITYFMICFIIGKSLLSIPDVAGFLQQNMNKILGPVLVITGLFLLEVIKIPSFGIKINQNAQKWAMKNNVTGALFLGILFALAFCPVSAALFFGSVVPIALKYKSVILIPLIYGLGTALPVMFFAFVISFSIQSAGKIFDKLTVFELWARKSAAVIFIITGAYFIFKYLIIKQ